MLMMLMMRTCSGTGPESLPADAHDAHVWGQGASQLMLMMRTLGDEANEPPS